MTNLASRIDISSRLRGISMTSSSSLASVNQDIEATGTTSISDEIKWIRRFDVLTGQYIWEDRSQQVTFDSNPFKNVSLNDIPMAERNKWICVFDEKENRNFYVHVSSGTEQWEEPKTVNLASSETIHSQRKAYLLEDYAISHYNLSGGLFRSKIPVKIAMSHSNEPLSRPLLNINSSCSDVALRINKEIVRYTNNKEPIHLQRLIAYMLLSPQELIDECFCQVLKQMTACNTQYDRITLSMFRIIIDRAWQILTILSASILPSDELYDYLEYYIQTSTNTLQVELSQRCLQMLQRCKVVGSRHEVPTLTEIKHIFNDEEAEITIDLLSGRQITLCISILSQAKDVVEYLGKKLQLKDDIKLFQLFTVSGKYESRLSDDCRLMDYFASWEIKGDTQSHMVLAIAFYFTYDIFNQHVLELVFFQAVHDIHNGRYFCSDDDYFTLAALALQQRLQDFTGDSSILGREIYQLLPRRLQRLSSENEVMNIYTKLRGYTSQECMLSLLEYIQSWNEYGVHHFYGDV